MTPAESRRRIRFSIHTGPVAANDVAAKLLDHEFFNIIAGTEHVHASAILEPHELLDTVLYEALGYRPSRVVTYHRSHEQPNPNNDHEDDGC